MHVGPAVSAACPFTLCLCEGCAADLCLSVLRPWVCPSPWGACIYQERLTWPLGRWLWSLTTGVHCTPRPGTRVRLALQLLSRAQFGLTATCAASQRDRGAAAFSGRSVCAPGRGPCCAEEVSSPMHCSGAQGGLCSPATDTKPWESNSET